MVQFQFIWRITFWYAILLISELAPAGAGYSQGISDVTKELGLNGVDGVIAAFGDFDSDRDTDIFVITDQGTKVEVYLWEGSNVKFSKASAYIKVNAREVITNVSPADFDGDGCMDLLVVTKSSDKVMLNAIIYWSNDKTLTRGYETEVSDEPLILDTNGDLLPDLFGTDAAGERKYWISQSGISGGRRLFIGQNQSDVVTASIKVPNSNAFVDMTKDFHADLFVVAQTPKSILFEIWQSKKGMLEFNSELTTKLPELAKNIPAESLGQVSFGDFDADGNIDVLVPICLTKDCKSSSFYILRNGKWNLMLSNEQSWWKFPSSKGGGVFSFQLVARVGDITMDGYPDAVCIFENLKGGKRAVILENTPCRSGSKNCDGPRTFTVKRNIPIMKNIKNPAVVMLFDLYENGALDLFVVEEKDGKAGKYAIRAIKNDFSADTSFLKTAVLSGRCYKNCACRSSHTPYGANQPGAMVRYKTTVTDGKTRIGTATQLCQSAYFSLQLPYIVFGLGRTPNFVDEIEVGIPQGSAAVNRVHQWQSLIPNSQVIVLPFPPDEPSEWQTKLLVTPSKILLQVGGVLLGTCLLVAGFILILHIKEKREDEREKRQEAHKFHFDAL